VKVLAISLTLLLAAGTVFAATLVLQPDAAAGKDSHIRQGGPSSNYGTYPQLTVNWSPNQPNRGIVEFNLSPISGATINSAYIDLYNRANSPRDFFGIYRVNASWSEMSVTWSNQPAHFATAYASVNVPSTGSFRFDVKTLVSEWAGGTYVNYGFKLIKRTESGTYPYFCSSDHATSTWRPKITVDYTPSAIAPTSFGKVKALYR
jgi:hypothetical protein